MKTYISKLFGLFLCSVLVGCVSLPEKYWVPPDEGVIRDRVAAISVAHAIWKSMHPSMEVASEEVWQKEMVAQREGQVWRIFEKPLDLDEIGGTVEIDISAIDGRVLQIIMTQ